MRLLKFWAAAHRARLARRPSRAERHFERLLYLDRIHRQWSHARPTLWHCHFYDVHKERRSALWYVEVIDLTTTDTDE